MEEKSTLVELLVTEHKGVEPELFFRNTVRVFVNRDYTYGLWVGERELFDMLSEDQKKEYLKPGTYLILQVEVGVAKKVVEAGVSPYSKDNLSLRL